MENVFDSLSAALTEPEIKKHFMEAEGIDLMVLMMKYVYALHSPCLRTLTIFRDKKDHSARCVKVLDFSMSGPAGTPCCETFVEALGLKTLFSAFMGKVSAYKFGL